VSCGSTKYKDATRNGWLQGCEAKASCCSDKARCSTRTCPAGKQLKANAYDLYCATSTCGAADDTTCCESDATVCAGATVTCGADKYKDPAKHSESLTDVKTKCCTARTKCLPNPPAANATGAAVAGSPRVCTISVLALALALVMMMFLG
jgi:hypothetical protein